MSCGTAVRLLLLRYRWECDGDVSGNAGAVVQLGKRDCLHIHEIGEQARHQFCERVEVQVSTERIMAAMELPMTPYVAEQLFERKEISVN